MFFDFQRINLALLIFLAVGGAICAILFYGYLKYRRYMALRKLHKTVAAAAYDMLTDVLIPDGMDGNLYVDFLLLTQRGILVLDLKETPGLIFGGDQMNEWTVMNRNSRYTFPNPQGPLFDRIAALKQLAGDTPVEGRVLFTDRTKFPKGQPKSALMLDSLKMEYSPVDNVALLGVVEKFRPGWENVKANAQPSDLKRR